MKGVPDLPYAAKLFIVLNSCGPDRERESSHFAALSGRYRLEEPNILESGADVTGRFSLPRFSDLSPRPCEEEHARDKNGEPEQIVRRMRCKWLKDRRHRLFARVFRLDLCSFDGGLIVSKSRTIFSNFSRYRARGFEDGPRSGLTWRSCGQIKLFPRLRPKRFGQPNPSLIEAPHCSNPQSHQPRE